MGRYGWKNRDGVATVRRTKEGPDAECAECNWYVSALDEGRWLAIRAAARRHVAKTGHRVHATVRNVYTYGPEEDR